MKMQRGALIGGLAAVLTLGAIGSCLKTSPTQQLSVRLPAADYLFIDTTRNFVVTSTGGGQTTENRF